MIPTLLDYMNGGAGRADHIDGLAQDFAAQLLPFLQAAPDGGVRIQSGYRSVERQQQLWDEALAKYGSPEAARRWVAPPGNSQHNHGGAADLDYASDAAREWAHANAAAYGLNFRMGHEPWHIELENAGAAGGEHVPSASAAAGAGAPGGANFLPPRPEARPAGFADMLLASGMIPSPEAPAVAMSAPAADPFPAMLQQQRAKRGQQMERHQGRDVSDILADLANTVIRRS